MDMQAFSLRDKYTLTRGRIFLNGTQALTRLMLLQAQRDKHNGLNTAGFVSGYRGSPLGNLDKSLWSINDLLAENNITFQPGLNEDLAATSVWGSQQINLHLKAKFDGVFSLWYGKGPGIDRSGDVFRHANAAGTAPLGGVLLCMGDDHTAKSSTLPHQSEFAMMDAGIPVLNPASLQELLDFGLHGWAMSRYSGCWVGLKTISESMDSSASVSADSSRVQTIKPHDFTFPDSGVHIRLSDTPQEQELRLQKYKLYAAIAYARTNSLNRIIFDSPVPRLGIITTGKSYMDVREALRDLGIDSKLAREIGLRLYKIGMPWPLDSQGVQDFADGLDEILVVEEKRALIENQLKEQLYNWSAEQRPRVVGKFDERGEWLLPSMDELTPARIAKVIARRTSRFVTSQSIRDRLAFLEQKERALQKTSLSVLRKPHFCSGCPHNTSTKVPAGSVASAGIGCHYMVRWMGRNTELFTQMGGEGAPWIGQAPFCHTKHIFVNLGDGTYFHSGSLAIRAAVAAGVNVTYKILYNQAVAMTGGQPVDGELSIDQLTHQLAAEGVKHIVVVTSQPKNNPNIASLAPGVKVYPRDQFDAIQKSIKEVKGVSALIYDQQCATEKRRLIKRGKLAATNAFAYINPDVCENCGDCSQKSNCLSVVPVNTPLGRKRQIDQAACNHDYSCINGFCPSFVTIEGRRKAPDTTLKVADVQALPEPDISLSKSPYSIVITGVGGTGIVTLGAILGVAAHLEGKGINVLDMTGLAQKFGAVTSHLQIAAQSSDLYAARIAAGHADLLLGCDGVTACGADTLAKLDHQHSRAIINKSISVSADILNDPDYPSPAQEIHQLISDSVKPENAYFIDSISIAQKACGDPIASNMLMVGYAWQLGLIPLSRQSIEQAIHINKMGVEMNLAAFNWGRKLANNHQTTEKELGIEPKAKPSLEQTIHTQTAHLRDYQDEALVNRYLEQVNRIRRLEEKITDSTDLSQTVAEQYGRLLAIKDEYEVARLLTSDKFAAEVGAEFEHGYRVKCHLAPPIFSRAAEPKKWSFGPWLKPALTLLASLRKTRNTWLDPFRYSTDRKLELALLAKYEALLRYIAENLQSQNYADLARLAKEFEQVRGFGHIRASSMKNLSKRWRPEISG